MQDKSVPLWIAKREIKKLLELSFLHKENLRTIFIALATHLPHMDQVSTCFLEGRVTASLHLVHLVWSSEFKWAEMTTGHLAIPHRKPLQYVAKKEERAGCGCRFSRSYLHLVKCYHQLSVLCSASAAPCFFNVNFFQFLRLMSVQETQAVQWVPWFLSASYTTNENNIFFVYSSVPTDNLKHSKIPRLVPISSKMYYLILPKSER